MLYYNYSFNFLFIHHLVSKNNDKVGCQAYNLVSQIVFAMTKLREPLEQAARERQMRKPNSVLPIFSKTEYEAIHVHEELASSYHHPVVDWKRNRARMLHAEQTQIPS